MKTALSRFKFHTSLCLRVQSTINQQWFKIMAWGQIGDKLLSWSTFTDSYINGLTLKRCNFIANPLELCLFCIKPLIGINWPFMCWTVSTKVKNLFVSSISSSHQGGAGGLNPPRYKTLTCLLKLSTTAAGDLATLGAPWVTWINFNPSMGK